MALSSDLMGLGVSPLLAARTATGGIGPLNIAVSGPSNAFPTSATLGKLGCSQFVVTATGLTSGGIVLPPIGGDNGALLADDFVINNTGTSTILVWGNPQTTVLISARGSNNSYQYVPIHSSITLYPVSSTQWIGISGS